MMHCGYEPTAASACSAKPGDTVENDQVQLRREARAGDAGRGRGGVQWRERGQRASRRARTDPKLHRPSVSRELNARASPTLSAADQAADSAGSRRHRAAAQQNLLRLQHADGYWCGELFVDSTLCSDYVLFMHWADEVDPVLQEKCVAHIRRRQIAGRRLEHLRGRPERGERDASKPTSR